MRSLRTAGSLALLIMSLIPAVLGLGLSGCKTRDGAEGPMTDPAVVYQRAHKALLRGRLPLAIRIYEALMARYPFAAETRQSRLDVIYAYYRAGESESAIDAADTFIRENPTHPRIDYAWYLKGLTDFERMPNFMERWFRVDLNQRPPTQARRSFTAFQTVVEQYPNSEYAHDARRRMVYLRNRLADYEIAVAKYYIGREARTSPPRSAPRSPSRNSTARPPCARRSRSWCSATTGWSSRSSPRRPAPCIARTTKAKSASGRISPKKKWCKLWLATDAASVDNPKVIG